MAQRRERGMGMLRPKGLHRYELRYRRQQRTIRATTKTELNEKVKEAIADIDGGSTADGNTKLRVWVEEWLDKREVKIRHTTLQRYRALMRDFVYDEIGDMKLNDLGTVHIERVIKNMTKEGAAPATVVQAFRVLSAALRSARKKNPPVIKFNPCDAVENLPRVLKDRADPPTTVEVQAILAEARGTEWFPIMALYAGSGLRRGEAVGLRWSDIDLEKATASLNRTAQPVRGDSRRVLDLPPKTPRSRRTVRLPGFVVEALSEWKAKQNERKVRSGVRSDDVFTAPTGGRYHPDSVTHAFVRLSRAAGVDCRLHDLRHFVASELLRSGVNIKIVSERLGHSSTSFTMDTYAHLLPDDQATAAEALEIALG
jgi:integrase